MDRKKCASLLRAPVAISPSEANGLEFTMISSVLALLAAASAAQATDQTRASREAFTACLRGYVQRSVEARMTLQAFQAEYPQQCAAQETAFREAIMRREVALRATRATAEQSANLEIEDARVNFSERFEMSVTPQ
jgi:hypothetical protein